MPEKGFNISFSTHGGRKFRNINISGRKLIAFRIITGLTLLAVMALVIFTALYFMYSAENKELKRENDAKSDSLAAMIELEARMELLKEQLQEIIEAKIIIENLARVIDR